MRFFFIGGARPEAWDRNPSTQGNTYSANGVAPHALTNRISYTAPAGKKARLMHSCMTMLRVTAAAPVGKWECNVTPFNSAAVIFTAMSRASLGNVVGDSIFQNVGLCGMILPGDSIRGQTGDASTGGTIDIQMGIALEECDA